jgi:hypothetical protein
VSARSPLARRALLGGLLTTTLTGLAACGPQPRRPPTQAVMQPTPDVVPLGDASPLFTVKETSLHFGCDSSYSPITTQFMEDAILYLSGRRPVFWGRYFNHSSGKDSRRQISYQAAYENPVLARYRCRVLPVFAQNTSGGPLSLGRRDGLENGRDFIETLGASRLAANGPE